MGRKEYNPASCEHVRELHFHPRLIFPRAVLFKATLRRASSEGQTSSQLSVGVSQTPSTTSLTHPEPILNVGWEGKQVMQMLSLYKTTRWAGIFAHH